MANAIHKTEASDTLLSVIETFYAVRDVQGAPRAVDQGKVSQVIRDQTPTDLSAYSDSDTLPTGTELHVPTVRSVSRALLVPADIHADLRSDLEDNGLRSANALLSREQQDVSDLLDPASAPNYDQSDFDRAWVLTQFLDLDGMDPYTAIHLHDDQGITSLQELSEQSPATIADRDPVGIRLGLDAGLAHSELGLDPDPLTPFCPVEELEDWVKAHFYAGSTPEPAFSPEGRWVIKASPSNVEALDEGWLELDEEGDAATTTSGPLRGTKGATASGLAKYDDGTAWTHLTLSVKLAHRGGTARLRVRDDGTTHYAVELSPTQVRLLRVTTGTATELKARSLGYPSDEYLEVSLTDVAHRLSVAIDGITIFEDVPGGGTQSAGTIALEVTDHATGPVPVDFDDVKVTRLTGLGEEKETLLEEPFTSTLPDDWTFTDGTVAWAISSTGHNRLDLSSLDNLLLQLEYTYKMNVGQV